MVYQQQLKQMNQEGTARSSVDTECGGGYYLTDFDKFLNDDTPSASIIFTTGLELKTRYGHLHACGCGHHCDLALFKFDFLAITKIQLSIKELGGWSDELIMPAAVCRAVLHQQVMIEIGSIVQYGELKHYKLDTMDEYGVILKFVQAQRGNRDAFEWALNLASLRQARKELRDGK